MSAPAVTRDLAGEIAAYLVEHGEATAEEIRQAIRARKSHVIHLLNTDERFSGPLRASAGGRSKIYRLAARNGQEPIGNGRERVPDAEPPIDLEELERWALDALALLAEPQPIFINKEARMFIERVHESGVVNRTECDELTTVTITKRKPTSRRGSYGPETDYEVTEDTFSLADHASFQLVREASSGFGPDPTQPPIPEEHNDA